MFFHIRMVEGRKNFVVKERGCPTWRPLLCNFAYNFVMFNCDGICISQKPLTNINVFYIMWSQLRKEVFHFASQIIQVETHRQKGELVHMKKIAYRFVFFLLALSLIASPAFADDLYDKHTPDRNDPERLQQIQRIIAETNDAINNSYIPHSAGSKTLNVPLCKQENNYYCGPASVQMVLKYFGYTATQSKLGSIMNTNSSDGTYVYQIANGLNSYLGSGKYAYIYTSELSFGTKIVPSIDAGYPIVCHTQTKKLPHYDGHASGHYVVVIGYSWAQGGSTGGRETILTFNDPNNVSKYYGRYTCTYTEMNSAINANAGLYIAH